MTRTRELGSPFDSEDKSVALPCKNMSRAFVKEDVEVPERSARRRSASGLPPGAVNYMTARGAARLREKITEWRRAGNDPAAAELQRAVDSATIIQPPDITPTSVIFGSEVVVETVNGELRTYRVVGVDELEMEPNAISWTSSNGRALLGAEATDKVLIEGDQMPATIKSIGYPRD